MSTPTADEILAMADAAGAPLACIDGEVLTMALEDGDLLRLIAEHRQDIAIELMALRGDYEPESCAHELRVLKALQGCIVADARDLDGVQGARIAVEVAHQALADIQRLASTYRWLAKPENAAKPEFLERLRWAGHAALRLVAAGSSLNAFLRPAPRQAVLI